MKGIISALVWAGVWTAIIIFSVGLGLLPFGLVCFLIFVGATKREEKAHSSLSKTLMRDEELLNAAIQHRVFALWHRRALIAITSSRILVINRGLLGGFKMQDIQWKDLTDATIEQNVLPNLCGSNLAFKHSSGRVGQVAVDGVEDSVASEIYAKAQSEEQAWEEKRRVRAMEEVRAAAGGVVVHTAAQPTAPAPAASTSSQGGGNAMFEQIEKAKKLFDMGAISDAEFQEMKAKILSAA